MIKEICGAPTRTRTADLLITNQLLYQLSYRGARTVSSVGLPVAQSISGRRRRALGLRESAGVVDVMRPDRRHHRALAGIERLEPARRTPGIKVAVLETLAGIGPRSGGSIEGLPLHHYPAMGELQTKCPVEVQLTERREYELAEQGFIGLTYRKGSDNACFFSANSPQKVKIFGSDEAGRSDEMNYRLGTQLPYMFIITRLAHYIKVLQREQIGAWKERIDLERELNQWIRQYVVDMENPAASVRSRKPLRQASVDVEDVEGQPGWYRCRLTVRPHFKYMGASFSLSLVGKLDRE